MKMFFDDIRFPKYETIKPSWKECEQTVLVYSRVWTNSTSVFICNTRKQIILKKQH